MRPAGVEICSNLFVCQDVGIQSSGDPEQDLCAEGLWLHFLNVNTRSAFQHQYDHLITFCIAHAVLLSAFIPLCGADLDGLSCFLGLCLFK